MRCDATGRYCYARMKFLHLLLVGARNDWGVKRCGKIESNVFWHSASLTLSIFNYPGVILGYNVEISSEQLKDDAVK